MRLIDADALLKEVENEQKYLIARGQLSEEHILVHALKRPILDAPTIDAVPVVRCKDCEYWGTLSCGICWDDIVKKDADWYCKDGDRRSE